MKKRYSEVHSEMERLESDKVKSVKPIKGKVNKEDEGKDWNINQTIERDICVYINLFYFKIVIHCKTSYS
jgi:hypothetical protein